MNAANNPSPLERAPSPPRALTIANTAIRQDAEGRYCLNDLHGAAGGEQRHRPNYWLESQQTRALVSEIEIAGIPAISSKPKVGTYVCRELVYAYAMWISPAFHLKVIRAYDALTTQQPAFNPAGLSRLQLLELALQAERERLKLAARVDELAARVETLSGGAVDAAPVSPASGRRWLTVRQVAEAYPCFTTGGLRHLIFFASANGFNACIRRLGRRILLDTASLDAWIDRQGAKP